MSVECAPDLGVGEGSGAATMSTMTEGGGGGGRENKRETQCHPLMGGGSQRM